ncbi:Protease HtpX [Bacillus safensis subsp. safensis]
MPICSRILWIHSFEIFSRCFSPLHTGICDFLYDEANQNVHSIQAKSDACSRLPLDRSLSEKYANDIIVFHCHEPLAFAMGMLHPKVYLSTSLMDMLDEEEIDAVVYHELHHKYSYDPLKAFTFSMLTKVIWYIPVLKHMRQSYSVFREVIADDYAIRQTGTELGVGQALFKLIKKRTQFQKQTKFAVSFGDRVLNLRNTEDLKSNIQYSFQCTHHSHCHINHSHGGLNDYA